MEVATDHPMHLPKTSSRFSRTSRSSTIIIDSIPGLFSVSSFAQGWSFSSHSRATLSNVFFFLFMFLRNVSVSHPVCPPVVSSSDLRSNVSEARGSLASQFLRFLPAGYHPSRLRSLFVSSSDFAARWRSAISQVLRILSRRVLLKILISVDPSGRFGRFRSCFMNHRHRYVQASRMYSYLLFGYTRFPKLYRGSRPRSLAPLLSEVLLPEQENEMIPMEVSRSDHRVPK